MRVTFEALEGEFLRVLIKRGFAVGKATICARIFAENSLDGVISHGLNRFPVFIKAVEEGMVKIDTEPEPVLKAGSIEYWDGHLGPGMYTATLAMERAISLAKERGIGAVSLKRSNHWMRGGTYGLQAARQQCIGICVTNTMPNMPAWGSVEPRLGNNPLVISVPRDGGPLLLDMALSQFSYGKLQEYEWDKESLPVAGGYDAAGNLSTDPVAIKASKRTLPIGFWKGSGLSLMLDVLTAALSGGWSVGDIGANGKEFGLSQLFLCIDAQHMDKSIVERIIAYTEESAPIPGGGGVRYPGKRVDQTRKQHLELGIPVNENAWQTLKNL
jgi:3-dehydro-L-gulonate 2-dehydrogenase